MACQCFRKLILRKSRGIEETFSYMWRQKKVISTERRLLKIKPARENHKLFFHRRKKALDLYLILTGLFKIMKTVALRRDFEFFPKELNCTLCISRTISALDVFAEMKNV